MNARVLFIERTGLTWSIKDADGLCVSILSKDIVRYLIVLVKLHNDKSIIYFFTGEVINGTLNILTLIQSIIIGITISGINFRKLLIDTVHDNVHL